MEISITGKHIEVRPGMRSYIEARLEKLKRFFRSVDVARVVLKTEKYLNTAEISLNGKMLHLYAEGSSEENLYIAIDRACDRLENQIKRHMEKIREHHPREVQSLKERAVPASERIPPQGFFERETFDVKPMTLEEARMQLELAEREFLVFQNASSHEINVLYRKKNGGYGLIEPAR